MTFSPSPDALPLRHETLLSLNAGDEIRCIGGRMQVRTAGLAVDPWGLAPDASTLLPGRSWRMPCAGIVRLTPLETGSHFISIRQLPEHAHTQENRAYPGARRLWQGGLSALRLFGSSVR